MKRKELSDVVGSTVDEKCSNLGLAVGTEVDVRDLKRISGLYDIDAYLYFEEDLAREKSHEEVLRSYRDTPEYERPLVEVGDFLRFGEESDPGFRLRLKEYPLKVVIVSVGEYAEPPGKRSRYYVTAIMPFIDEIDFEGEEEPWEKDHRVVTAYPAR